MFVSAKTITAMASRTKLSNRNLFSIYKH